VRGKSRKIDPPPKKDTETVVVVGLNEKGSHKVNTSRIVQHLRHSRETLMVLDLEHKFRDE